MGSFVYAIFGTAKDIAIGPSVVVSILAATYGTGNAPIAKDPTYAILLALFSGILQAAMGLLRLGE
jgi:MFS superfamily sulfate permease-like transporter